MAESVGRSIADSQRQGFRAHTLKSKPLSAAFYHTLRDVQHFRVARDGDSKTILGNTACH
jgi:hypothetical protein